MSGILHDVLAVSRAAFQSTHLILALIGVSLVMLGRGSWPIDVRLYGRKRIDLGISSERIVNWKCK